MATIYYGRLRIASVLKLYLGKTTCETLNLINKLRQFGFECIYTPDDKVAIVEVVPDRSIPVDCPVFLRPETHLVPAHRPIITFTLPYRTIHAKTRNLEVGDLVTLIIEEQAICFRYQKTSFTDSCWVPPNFPITPPANMTT